MNQLVHVVLCYFTTDSFIHSETQKSKFILVSKIRSMKCLFDLIRIQDKTHIVGVNLDL